MTSTDAKSVVLAYLKAIDERNPEAIQANPLGGRRVPHPRRPRTRRQLGRHGRILNKFMLPLMDLFSPDVPYTIETSQIVAEGDTVVLDCVARSASRSGKPYEANIVSVFS
ncbi:hypothetical protein, partial [Microbacterium terregens]|uniref:hypothetical protein n=1 Tax=Microbacterium terregens TaxID=69363 RepID=UPI0031D8B9C5